jgi:hypothetical protein
MNRELDEFIEQQLVGFPDQDVLVYYERSGLKLTYGFFVWNGYAHDHTTISELLRDGFEKSDIKELRSESKKILVIEKLFREFEVEV